MTVLILFAGAARTRVVTTDLLVDVDWGVALWLAAVCHEVCAACLELAHVRDGATLRRGLARSGRRISDWICAIRR